MKVTPVVGMLGRDAVPSAAPSGMSVCDLSDCVQSQPNGSPSLDIGTSDEDKLVYMSCALSEGF